MTKPVQENLTTLLNPPLAFIDDTSGATSLEYTLIVALISLAMLAFFGATATSMGDTFSDVASEVAAN